MDGSEEEERLQPAKRYRGQRGPNKVKKPTMSLVAVRLPNDIVEHFSHFSNATGQIRRVLVEHVASTTSNENYPSTNTNGAEIEPVSQVFVDDDNPRGDFVVSLSENAYSYFTKFPNPVRIMEQILQGYAVQYGGKDIEGGDVMGDQDVSIIEIDYFKLASQENAAQREDGYSQIERVILRSNDPLETYGSLRKAAVLAVEHFGTNWLASEASSSGFPTRRKLRELVFNALPKGYSNKSVAWARFQKYAREHADPLR